MGIAPLLGLCLLFFALAYALYGRWLARLHRLDEGTRTPAHLCRDGRDFEPVGRFALLSQHFSAISAAGPIAGPVLAGLAFGWGPALLWIALGCVFIGALHDFSTLIGSVRHGACSVAELLRHYLNRRTFALFSAYIWLALVYVIIAFTDITARAFVEDLRVELGEGEELVVRGASVASSSLLYLLLGLAMGLCTRFLRFPLWLSTLVFVPLVALAIWVGPALPVELQSAGPVPSLAWAWVILAYCGLASLLPVWSLLQPRGYLGGFFLYLTLGGGLIGLLVANPEVAWPRFSGFESAAGQPLVPFLFITIACGACSGFHGLVCSGTTSKQLDRERDAQLVGYGAMLLEGVVALLALACVMWIASDSPVAKLTPDKIFGWGVGNFLAALGIPLEFAISFASLAFATFVYDTLDVCTRLGRYLFQEATGWKSRAGGIAGTVVTLALPFYVVSQTGVNAAGKLVPAYQLIWPLFGSSNQLLAGLSLLSLVLWLVRSGKPRILVWLAAVPMAFMLSMTMLALVLQIRGQSASTALLVVGSLLLALALWVVAEAVWALVRGSTSSPG